MVNRLEVELALGQSAIPLHSRVLAEALGATTQVIEELLGQLETLGRVHREGDRWAANAIVGSSLP